jgi:small-conductance mechanosensitive channel
MPADISPELAEYKDLTPEERAAEKALGEAIVAQREADDLAREVARLRKLSEALEHIPPELILAAAIDRHAAAIREVAKQHERVADSIEEMAVLYRDHLERDVRGAAGS